METLTFTTETDVIITDPAYFIPGEIWAATGYGVKLPFGHITANTGIGDGSFEVLSADDTDTIGTYTADTGQTTIAALDDVINNYGYVLAGIRPECYAIVKAFKGTIRAEYVSGELIIVGEGTPAFRTKSIMPDLWPFDDYDF